MENIKKLINDNIDVKYREFSKNLLPNVDNVLGVRVPVLKNIAREVAKDDPIFYLDNVTNDSFEEVMLEGLVIGNLKVSKETVLVYIDRFVYKINNWSVCDAFCTSLKIVNTDKDYFFKYLLKFKNSKKEFELRFMLVMFLDYYIDKKYITKIFKIIDNIKSSDYYAQMAIAWCLSMCYIKYEDATLDFLERCNLDDWTYNKTIQKIIESRQVEPSIKEKLKKMKRK